MKTAVLVIDVQRAFATTRRAPMRPTRWCSASTRSPNAPALPARRWPSSSTRTRSTSNSTRSAGSSRARWTPTRATRASARPRPTPSCARPWKPGSPGTAWNAWWSAATRRSSASTPRCAAPPRWATTWCSRRCAHFARQAARHGREDPRASQRHAVGHHELRRADPRNRQRGSRVRRL